MEPYELLVKSITSFYQECKSTEHSPLDERVATFRIGYFIQKLIEKDDKLKELIVDSEYHKHFDNKKEAFDLCKDCRSECKFKKDTAEYNFVINNKIQSMTLLKYTNLFDKKRMRPDLVIHSRRNDDNNFVIIEFKAKDHRKSNYGSDYAKLTYATCDYGAYHYQYGYFIVLDKEGVTICSFVNGEVEFTKNVRMI